MGGIAVMWWGGPRGGVVGTKAALEGDPTTIVRTKYLVKLAHVFFPYFAILVKSFSSKYTIITLSVPHNYIRYSKKPVLWIIESEIMPSKYIAVRIYSYILQNVLVKSESYYVSSCFAHCHYIYYTV